MDKKKIIIALTAIGVYLISTGISFALFSQGAKEKTSQPAFQPSQEEGAEGAMVFDESLPKTEECPLNGAYYSKKQKEWWEQHRPLGIMIENHQQARPQSGLSGADVMYEAVAEGGITRFLAVYYCQDGGIVGPVRSARTYYLEFLSEYGEYPLYAHVGGANSPGPADALSQIDDYGWTAYNDLNQFSIGFPTFLRDYDRLGRTVATEHTMYSTTGKLWEFAAKKRELTDKDKEGDSWDKTFVKYEFKDDAPLSQRAAAQTAHLEFWSGYSQYFVDWKYDQKSNSYKRSHATVAQVDKDNDKVLSAKTIVVLFMQESNAFDGYENNIHLLYKTKGSGKALVFMDGKKIQASWRKNNRTARTTLVDSQGREIEFNRGVIWFEIMPTTGVVTDK